MSEEAIAPLVELSSAPEIYCSELSWVETTGPNVRFVLSVDGFASGGYGGQPAKLVNLKVVLPLGAIIPAIDLTVRKLGLAATMRMLRVVK